MEVTQKSRHRDHQDISVVKMSGTRRNNLSLIIGIHMVEGEKKFPQVVLRSLHT